MTCMTVIIVRVVKRNIIQYVPTKKKITPCTEDTPKL